MQQQTKPVGSSVADLFCVSGASSVCNDLLVFVPACVTGSHLCRIRSWFELLGVVDFGSFRVPSCSEPVGENLFLPLLRTRYPLD
jgi:hypothetical protein